MAQSHNRILDSLPQNVYAALSPHLKTVNLPFAQIVAEPEETVKAVYFPHACVISLVVEMEVGDMIETAMVGRDGVANATSALDGKIALHRGIVQVAGEASVIDPDVLRSASPTIFSRSVRSSSAMNRCCSRRPSSRRDATQVTGWKRGCAAGCCVSGT